MILITMVSLDTPRRQDETGKTIYVKTEIETAFPSRRPWDTQPQKSSPLAHRATNTPRKPVKLPSITKPNNTYVAPRRRSVISSERDQDVVQRGLAAAIALSAAATIPFPSRSYNGATPASSPTKLHEGDPQPGVPANFTITPCVSCTCDRACPVVSPGRDRNHKKCTVCPRWQHLACAIDELKPITKNNRQCQVQRQFACNLCKLGASQQPRRTRNPLLDFSQIVTEFENHN